jgi:hypothetical protein
MKKSKKSVKVVPNKLIDDRNMKINGGIQFVYSSMASDLVKNETHYGVNNKKTGKYARIFSLLLFFTSIGILFTSCMGGFVASEPSYSEYARPQRQYDNQIWIAGDWGWNSQTHVYVQKAGYWDAPRAGHSYVEGRWQTTQRGKSWTKGHWQKDNNQKGHNQRSNPQRDNRQNDKSNR